jgi:hypothetical protein
VGVVAEVERGEHFAARGRDARPVGRVDDQAEAEAEAGVRVRMKPQSDVQSIVTRLAVMEPAARDAEVAKMLRGRVDLAEGAGMLELAFRGRLMTVLRERKLWPRSERSK